MPHQNLLEEEAISNVIKCIIRWRTKNSLYSATLPESKKGHQMKRFFYASALVLGCLTALLSGPVAAQVSVAINIGVPPPAPRYEAPPPPRGGYIWAPGYWNWDGYRHVWVQGHWERMRRGYEYDRPEWREGPRGWELHRGGWRRGEERHREHDNDDRDDGPRYHCPPGQAKKGNC